jgi:hypothetical protein
MRQITLETAPRKPSDNNHEQEPMVSGIVINRSKVSQPINNTIGSPCKSASFA